MRDRMSVLDSIVLFVIGKQRGSLDKLALYMARTSFFSLEEIRGPVRDFMNGELRKALIDSNREGVSIDKILWRNRRTRVRK
jgi:hypothetical protein